MEISSENTSFNYLRSSPEFLNIVLNSISSCVLLLNSEMRLQAFNDAFRTIFTDSHDQAVLYSKCGNAIGCATAVENLIDCGTHDHCKICPLRKAGIMTYTDGVEYHKNIIRRQFFTREGEKLEKVLQFSTRRIVFNDDRYTLMIIDDVTELVENGELIAKQQQLIQTLRDSTS